MGVVTYVIDYTPKTIKAQLSPLSTLGGVWGGEGGKRVGGKERIFFYLNNKRKIREKVVILIDNLLQTGKMFLYWFVGWGFLSFCHIYSWWHCVASVGGSGLVFRVSVWDFQSNCISHSLTFSFLEQWEAQCYLYL